MFGFPIFGLGFDAHHFSVLHHHHLHHLNHLHLRHGLFVHHLFVTPFFLPFTPVVSSIVVALPQALPVQVPSAMPVETGEAQLAEAPPLLATLADAEQSIVSVGAGEAGWLGVSIAEVSAEKAKELKLPTERGVLITKVEADSPAGKVGLKANDVIVGFNDQRVDGTVQFRRLVHETPGGRTVQLTVWRDARAQTVSVELKARPAAAEPGRMSSRLTLLVFKDNSIAAVTDYWLKDGQLHYTTSYGGEAVVPLDRIDLEMTAQLNWERSSKFVLRPKPRNVQPETKLDPLRSDARFQDLLRRFDLLQ